MEKKFRLNLPPQYGDGYYVPAHARPATDRIAVIADNCASDIERWLLWREMKLQQDLYETLCGLDAMLDAITKGE